MTTRRDTQRTRRKQANLCKGLFFISPWVLGFLVFVIYPLLYSCIISLSRYSGLQAPIWLGLQNYRRLFSDPLIWTSIHNTLFYVLFAVPTGTIVALLLALAMNSSMKEVALYRTILYLPSILPLFALSFIFIVLVNPQYGIVNTFLELFGVSSTNYLGNPTSAKFVIVALAQLGAGNAALIFLAGLNAIPSTLYDAARIDGANRFFRFCWITLPLLSPILLFNLITAVSGGLQVFTPAYIMTQGGPDNGTLFYMYYLYKNAFSYAQVGYACAQATMLFLFGLLLAVIFYLIGQRFVHYEIVN